MRTRYLRPGFFSNEILCQLPPLTRILFSGLWLIADCNGVLEDRPARIKASILPYDACDVVEMISELARAGFIVRYTDGDNHPMICVVKFRDHQHPHPRETPVFVPYRKPDTDHIRANSCEKLTTGKMPGKNPAKNPGKMPGKNDPESPGSESVSYSYSDSDSYSDLDLLTLTPQQTESELVGKKSKRVSIRTQFDLIAIYQLYPRKLGKSGGLRRLSRDIRSESDYQRLRRAVVYFASEMRREQRAEDRIPYFSTWANSQWGDWADKAEGANGQEPERPDFGPRKLWTADELKKLTGES